ncbi:MAG: FAD-dependent oxidoreductase [Akkermansiaceae bacterium]|nr:FAD-dependent oxidoreductase [Akkermansiaceae bacterium]
MTRTSETDVLIIGAAALGLSAACAYRRGRPESSVRIVEKGARRDYRDEVGSQGNLRGSRSVMQSDMLHSFICKTWDFMAWLEREMDCRILSPTSSETPYLMLSQKAQHARSIVQTLEARAIPYECYDVAEANQRFQLRMPSHYAAVINAFDSKRIHLGNYIDAMHRHLLRRGAGESFETTVIRASIRPDGTSEVFLSNGEVVTAGDVIVCAGENTSSVLAHFIDKAAMPARMREQNIRKIPQKTLHLKLPARCKLHTIYNLDIGSDGALGFYMFPEVIRGEVVLKIGYDPMRKSQHDAGELSRQVKLMLDYVAQTYGVRPDEIEIVAEHECYYMIDATHEICAGRIAGTRIHVGSNFIGYGVMAGYGAFHNALWGNPPDAPISPSRPITDAQQTTFHSTYNDEQTFASTTAWITPAD